MKDKSTIPMSGSTRNSLEAIRSTATEIFNAAIAGCNVASALDQTISFQGNEVRRLMPQNGGPATIDLNKYEHIFVIAMGKAAGPMLDALLGRMQRRKGLRGICCWNEIPKERTGCIDYFAGGHPLPNKDSFVAARATLDLLSRANQDTLIFFLISGGGSAMLELPLDPQITLEETIHFHQLLLGSGAPIDQVNILRKHFSAVKAGRLAIAAAEAMKLSFLLPDVPLQSLDALSSGPTSMDRSTMEDVRAILSRYRLSDKLSESVRVFFEREGLPGRAGQEERLSPSRGEKRLCATTARRAFRNSAFDVLLSSLDLQKSARALAENADYFVVIDNRCDDWDYADAAQYLMERFHNLRAKHSRLCIISVGEVTVKLSEKPGMGGRNHQFVLQCSLDLANHQNDSLVVFSAGSDGIDGNTRAAGAIVDVTTVARAKALGYDPHASLAAFNSHQLLDALNDTIVIGPSGQNLRDLRLLMAVRT